jgi:hypothetical protein
VGGGQWGISSRTDLKHVGASRQGIDRCGLCMYVCRYVGNVMGIISSMNNKWD